jgi:hypothetical protein
MVSAWISWHETSPSTTSPVNCRQVVDHQLSCPDVLRLHQWDVWLALARLTEHNDTEHKLDLSGYWKTTMVSRHDVEAFHLHEAVCCKIDIDFLLSLARSLVERWKPAALYQSAKVCGK